MLPRCCLPGFVARSAHPPGRTELPPAWLAPRSRVGCAVTLLHRSLVASVTVLLFMPPGVGRADDAAALRLVPFPKQVELRAGTLALDRKLVLEIAADAAGSVGPLIGLELQRAGLPALKIRPVAGRSQLWRLAAEPGAGAPGPDLPDSVSPEAYALEVRPEGVVCRARDSAGLFYGGQTLCQLIRANRHGHAIPCLAVRDWPSLRWRCFQDDLTRGPSSTLTTLNRQVELGAALKMNMLTYYMEYQYAFKKHPDIGPKDGSLTPEELAALVAYAAPRHVEILGNQQSFGHFARILQHDQYALLRETPGILTPVKEESYQLLDDLYSEVCPILPFEMFNVCCDETEGLGTGPSKELAERIGVGGVYVRHMRRVHDLLKDKYHKRMMMWGDIILQHADRLAEVPKDTVMLTWGYRPRQSFEDQIVPFVRSGYEFFVCPGISNWSRILPDFGVATTNICNFVRDGARLGALGMLNTAWEDDGEALQGVKWHGYAWGAECAWNASTTTADQFNRRVGAVLFGEQGDHFGQAIELLARTHRLDGMAGMSNRRFWENDFQSQRTGQDIRAAAGGLLALVRPAIEQLEACKEDATVNADLLDRFLFGARRMERIGQRMLDGLAAASAYGRARAAAQKEQKLAALAEVQRLVESNRAAHAALGREFTRLWLEESKPYALDWTMTRYAKRVQWYDDLASRLAAAGQAAAAGTPLPAPAAIGLAAP